MGRKALPHKRLFFSPPRLLHSVLSIIKPFFISENKKKMIFSMMWRSRFNCFFFSFLTLQRYVCKNVSCRKQFSSFYRLHNKFSINHFMFKQQRQDNVWKFLTRNIAATWGIRIIVIALAKPLDSRHGSVVAWSSCFSFVIWEIYG